MPQQTRRHFLQAATVTAAAAALPDRLLAQNASSTLTIKVKPVTTVPADFTGLSYESPQLANPAFFSPKNTELVKIYRELSPNGVLRTGGNLSAFTGWRDDPKVPLTVAEQAAFDKGKRYWEWDLTDPTIRSGNHVAVFTPASIETLAGFLEATGWRLLYGLNFGTGTPEQAAAEAACVQRLVGKNLIAFQLGNEIDFWVGGLRPKSWDFDSYYAQWKEWVSVIRSAVPNAPFGGPDVAIRLDWMEKLAEHEKNDIAVLTKHHYAMGPAGDPKMNAARLLGPDPDVAKEIASAQRAKAFAGVGFRTAECGSCFHGGQPGVSNGFASALWGADYMLTLAQGGHAGINMHGGGEGFYSPITGDEAKGFTRQPLFFGMQFAQRFAGATLLECNLTTANNVTAYAGRQGDELLVGIINKDAVPATIQMNKTALGKMRAVEAWRLSAPALDSRTGVTLERVASVEGDRFEVAPTTAILLRYKTGA